MLTTVTEKIGKLLHMEAKQFSAICYTAKP